MTSKTLHGSRILCYINGVLCGVCTGISAIIAVPRSVIKTIDSLIPAELIPVAVDVTGTINLVRTGTSGGAQGPGLMAPQSLIDKERYFTIQLIDRVTQFEIFRADFCSSQSETWSVTPKGLLAGVINYTGIGYATQYDSVGSF